jgi:hypothetical protein
MSKKLVRNLTLAVVLGTLSGVAVHAQTTSPISTVSTDSVTGADPVPTSPTQKPSAVIAIILLIVSAAL